MRLKKFLGQHFLINRQISEEIVRIFLAQPPAQILEIGPGAGALTDLILPHCARHHIAYKAIELDEEKVVFLKKRFSDYAACFLQEDILSAALPFAASFDVIGNLPYNISSPIVFRCLEWQQSVRRMTLMFQKEVALRICARPGSKTYGILSVLTGLFFTPKLVLEVAPDAFKPPPQVQSAVVVFEKIPPRLSYEDFPAFKQMVKLAFSARRKLLKNNLQHLITPTGLTHTLLQKRAEQLSVSDFLELFAQRKRRL